MDGHLGAALTREDYKRKFEACDQDKDGNLTLSELQIYLSELLNTDVSDFAVKSVFDSLDKSKDGLISVDEWLDALDKKPLKNLGREDLMETFSKIDKNGDGKITKEEIKEIMKSKNAPVTDEELDNMMLMYDKDKDGSIDIEEFVNGFYKDL